MIALGSILLLFPFYIWVNWVPESLRNLPNTTQPSSARDGVWTTMVKFYKGNKSPGYWESKWNIERGRQEEKGLPLGRMRTWYCDCVRGGIYEKPRERCRVWRTLVRDHWAFSSCHVLKLVWLSCKSYNICTPRRCHFAVEGLRVGQ